jgi:hypothetical protein
VPVSLWFGPLHVLQYDSFILALTFVCLCCKTTVIQPLSGIVSSFDQSGAVNTDPSEIPFWGMVGAFCLFLNGFSSVIAGFAACAADSSHILVTTYLIVINQVSRQWLERAGWRLNVHLDTVTNHPQSRWIMVA